MVQKKCRFLFFPFLTQIVVFTCVVLYMRFAPSPVSLCYAIDIDVSPLIVVLFQLTGIVIIKVITWFDSELSFEYGRKLYHTVLVTGGHYDWLQQLGMKKKKKKRN